MTIFILIFGSIVDAVSEMISRLSPMIASAAFQRIVPDYEAVVGSYIIRSIV